MLDNTAPDALGVFAGLPNALYHGGPAVSKSGLDLIRRSPLHYRHARTVERKPTPDQRVGTIVHSLVLEPDTFWDNYARPFEAPADALATSEDVKGRLKDLGLPVSGKKPDLIERLRAADPDAVFLDDLRAAHAAEAEGKEIISEEELSKAEAMRDAIAAHPSASRLLDPAAGVAELSCRWHDPETGLLCQCRPDFWRRDGLVVDLKTAVDASPDAFSRSLQSWRYHVQAAFYLDGIREALKQGQTLDMPEPRAFIFVAVEKTAPHAVGVYSIGAQSVEIGRREYREDLSLFAQCVQSDEWPGYGDRVQPISLPDWRLRREEIEQEITV